MGKDLKDDRLNYHKSSVKDTFKHAFISFTRCSSVEAQKDPSVDFRLQVGGTPISTSINTT